MFLLTGLILHIELSNIKINVVPTFGHNHSCADIAYSLIVILCLSTRLASPYFSLPMEIYIYKKSKKPQASCVTKQQQQQKKTWIYKYTGASK